MAAHEIPVEDLMDVPQGDEVGTPAECLERCDRHDVIYRVGGACLACEREEDEEAE